ncbi:DUF262 domain-containing protein [Arthrobacter sp. zg-Y1143]|uniref:DUF262 domain-containing protein n=1 Tax=Arthrobacter sp. zg-Y1143 TaxID=3049065 RepID=UPI0024C3A2B7|nr:DUF262 domain-containing protein [Arthrobacter sp. zg-Y1143]MDK1328263.1 DUF262 domain-containing protein [Arthrobacter sp. zg-Y1143]
MRIRTERIPELTISKFRRMQEVIDEDPPYQREGGIWGGDTRAALIDSIINGFDLPKLYFEKASVRHKTPSGLTYQYAVIDGKQRLEAVQSFLADDLRLSPDFRFFEDEGVKAGGLSLSELKEKYPLLAQRFLDFELPVVSVSTDTGDLIEELFQRLNASSSLTAAERRNAISGATRDAANALAEHSALVRCSPIRNARFKYRELSAKFLAIEHQTAKKGRVLDTKAATLYDLFVATHSTPAAISTTEMHEYQRKVSETLDRFDRLFSEKDKLLASIGTFVVYYIVLREASTESVTNREKLMRFEELRQEAAKMSEDNPDYSSRGNARLREYNALVQSTNDGRALERRAEILRSFLMNGTERDALAGLERLGDVFDVPGEGTGDE